MAEKGIESIRVLPEIAALGERRSYLIVGQNSDELRATGGFLSMTMAVGVEDGRLRGNYIADANVVDNYYDKPYGDPPAAMREFIGIDLFLFRDSNYWPDFPTSGRKMMEFYTYGTGVELDGIFAVDIRFISRLIGAIGPIKVPETEIVLSEDNTLEILEQAWSDGLDLGGVSRKDFLGNIAAGLINHVQSDAFQPDIAALATIVDESVRDKSLQLYIDSSEEKLAFNRLGIDGRVQYQQGDDLLLVTANNVGVNKANRWVESSLKYDVVIAQDGSAEAQATSIWRHTGPPQTADEACDNSNFSYKPGEQYATMTLACFWNHLRFYAPANSSLIRADSYPIAAAEMKSNKEWAGETRTLEDDLSGFTVFENLMLVPMGNERSMTINYALDSVTSTNQQGQQTYRLNLMRQAGVYPYPPVEVQISLPEGSTLVTSSTEPVKVSGESVSFSTVLRENQVIELTFTPPENN